MLKKLYEIVANESEKRLLLSDRNIVVEEKFGESKNITKKYRIDRIFIEDDDILVSYNADDSDFSYTAYAKDLSKSFIGQIMFALVGIKNM